MEKGRVVGAKWRQLYLKNNKKIIKKEIEKLKILPKRRNTLKVSKACRAWTMMSNPKLLKRNRKTHV